jgi:hypothetical protein
MDKGPAGARWRRVRRRMHRLPPKLRSFIDAKAQAKAAPDALVAEIGVDGWGGVGRP